MPELPEVELARRDLAEWLLGQRVHLHLRDPDLLQADLAALSGEQLAEVARRGKFLLLHFASGARLVLHFRMTGKLQLTTPEDDATIERRTRLLLEGERAAVRFVDVRRLGQAWLLGPPTEAGRGGVAEAGVLARLGPEPWPEPLSGAALRQRLGTTRRAIKVALLDQEVVAGVGNIIAAESLWLAGVSPRRSSAALSEEALGRLGEAIVEVCSRVLAAEEAVDGPIDYISQSGMDGTTEYFMIYGREGEPCRRCGAAIERFKQSGRSTWWCPPCQQE